MPGAGFLDQLPGAWRGGCGRAVRCGQGLAELGPGAPGGPVREGEAGTDSGPAPREEKQAHDVPPSLGRVHSVRAAECGPGREPAQAEREDHGDPSSTTCPGAESFAVR
jgi:hypothetical protein